MTAAPISTLQGLDTVPAGKQWPSSMHCLHITCCSKAAIKLDTRSNVPMRLPLQKSRVEAQVALLLYQLKLAPRKHSQHLKSALDCGQQRRVCFGPGPQLLRLLQGRFPASHPLQQLQRDIHLQDINM